MNLFKAVILGMSFCASLSVSVCANGTALDNGQVTTVIVNKSIEIDQTLFFKNNLYIATESLQGSSVDSDTVSRLVKVKKNNGKLKTLVDDIPGRINKVLRKQANTLVASSTLTSGDSESDDLLQLDIANGIVTTLASFDVIHDFAKNKSGYLLIENSPDDNEAASQADAILRAGRIDGRQMLLQLDFNGQTVTELVLNDDYDHIYSVFGLKTNIIFEKSLLQTSCNDDESDEAEESCLEAKLSHDLDLLVPGLNGEDSTITNAFNGDFLNSSLSNQEDSVLLDAKVIKKKLYFLRNQTTILDPLVDLYRINFRGKDKIIAEDLDTNTVDFHLSSDLLYTLVHESDQTVLKEYDLDNGTSSSETVLSMTNNLDEDAKPIEIISSKNNKIVLLKYSAKDISLGTSNNPELQVLIYDLSNSSLATIGDSEAGF